MSNKGILAGLIAAGVTWFISALILADGLGMYTNAAMILSILPGLGAGIVGYKLLASPTDSTLVDTAASATRSTRETFSQIREKSENEESLDFYAIAEEEVEAETYDKGLWSKALVNVEGDKDKRAVEYMKLRVAQLQRERRVTNK